MIFIYREEYYESRKEPQEGTAEHYKWKERMDNIKNRCDVIVAKQRSGPIGTVSLYYDSGTTKFMNRSDVQLHHFVK